MGINSILHINVYVKYIFSLRSHQQFGEDNKLLNLGRTLSTNFRTEFCLPDVSDWWNITGNIHIY